MGPYYLTLFFLVAVSYVAASSNQIACEKANSEPGNSDNNLQDTIFFCNGTLSNQNQPDVNDKESPQASFKSSSQSSSTSVPLNTTHAPTKTSTTNNNNVEPNPSGSSLSASSSNATPEVIETTENDNTVSTEANDLAGGAAGGAASSEVDEELESSVANNGSGSKLDHISSTIDNQTLQEESGFAEESGEKEDSKNLATGSIAGGVVGVVLVVGVIGYIVKRKRNRTVFSNEAPVLPMHMNGYGRNIPPQEEDNAINFSMFEGSANSERTYLEPVVQRSSEHDFYDEGTITNYDSLYDDGNFANYDEVTGPNYDYGGAQIAVYDIASSKECDGETDRSLKKDKHIYDTGISDDTDALYGYIESVADNSGQTVYDNVGSQLELEFGLPGTDTTYDNICSQDKDVVYDFAS